VSGTESATDWERNEGGMPRLFSGWRLAHPHGLAADGEPHAYVSAEPGKTLFETIEQSGLPDDQTYILYRGPQVYVVLNVYPYTSGHVMVIPNKGFPSILDVPLPVYDELWATVRMAAVAVKDAFVPHGLNIGLNEGLAGGGSQPDHLHVHIVPRWRADTNFMTSIAEVRILPQTLSQTWHRLRDNWPAGLTSMP
jgi:ATP adenylyltransferase